MAGKRKATKQDLANVVAEWAVKEIHRSDASRKAWRDLPAAAQEEIHGWAADERQRRANGPQLTD